MLQLLVRLEDALELVALICLYDNLKNDLRRLRVRQLNFFHLESFQTNLLSSRRSSCSSHTPSFQVLSELEDLDHSSGRDLLGKVGCLEHNLASPIFPSIGVEESTLGHFGCLAFSDALDDVDSIQFARLVRVKETQDFLDSVEVGNLADRLLKLVLETIQAFHLFSSLKD